MDKQAKIIGIVIVILAGLTLLVGYFLFFKATSRETDLDDNSQTDRLSKEEKEKKKEENQKSTDESVGRDDCEDKCSRFKDDQSEFQNCQQICGLNQIQDTEDCDGAYGAEKDNCLKSLAIKQFNYNLCNLVQNSGVKEACKKRVSKDIFDKLDDSVEQ